MGMDIQKSCTVGGARAGGLASVTLIMRLSGAAVAGTLADKYGRKLPLNSFGAFSKIAFENGSQLVTIVARPSNGCGGGLLPVIGDLILDGESMLTCHLSKQTIDAPSVDIPT